MGTRTLMLEFTNNNRHLLTYFERHYIETQDYDTKEEFITVLNLLLEHTKDSILSDRIEDMIHELKEK